MRAVQRKAQLDLAAIDYFGLGAAPAAESQAAGQDVDSLLQLFRCHRSALFQGSGGIDLDHVISKIGAGH